MSEIKTKQNQMCYIVMDILLRSCFLNLWGRMSLKKNKMPHYHSNLTILIFTMYHSSLSYNFTVIYFKLKKKTLAV